MTLLFLFAASIAALTIWYLARPLRISRVETTDEHRDSLVQFRDRLLAQLREIDVEARDQNIDPTVADEERRRLEAELAATLKALDAKSGEKPDVSATSRRTWIVAMVTLAVILPLASLGLYLGKNVTILAQLGETPSATAGVPPAVLQMVSRLERRLAEQPDDARGWVMLGRSYSVLQRDIDARHAYARAYQLAPNDQEIMNAYAGFLMSLDPVRPTPEAMEIYEKLLAKNPKHPGALWAFGLSAFHEEQFGRAVKYWEQLLKQLPAESEAAPQVKLAIDTARAQAGKKK